MTTRGARARGRWRRHPARDHDERVRACDISSAYVNMCRRSVPCSRSSRRLRVAPPCVYVIRGVSSWGIRRNPADCADLISGGCRQMGGIAGDRPQRPAGMAPLRGDVCVRGGPDGVVTEASCGVRPGARLSSTGHHVGVRRDARWERCDCPEWTSIAARRFSGRSWTG